MNSTQLLGTRLFNLQKVSENGETAEYSRGDSGITNLVKSTVISIHVLTKENPRYKGI